MQLEEYSKIIASIINKIEPLHVLDYGCGEDIALARSLKSSGITCSFKYQAFDKAVPRFAAEPLPADVVVCTTLLGGLDYEDAEETLGDLRRVTECVGLFVISGSKRPAEWWLPRIMCRFELQTFQVVEDEFYVVVYSQPRAIENQQGEKLS